MCFGIAGRASDQQPRITQVVADAGAVTGVQRKRYLGDGEEGFTPTGTGPRPAPAPDRHKVKVSR